MLARMHRSANAQRSRTSTWTRLALLLLYAVSLVGRCLPAQTEPCSRDLPCQSRVTGLEPASGITYVLLSVDGTVMGVPQVSVPPRLTAQCTRLASGRLRFELLADFGNVPSISYLPPWRASPGDLYPPRLEKLDVTMEFLGYTRVKPLKRKWEFLPQISGEMRYSNPGTSSANMEEASFYLRYLRSLPTLALSLPNGTRAEFVTGGWQRSIAAEPVCRASGM